MVKKLRKRAEKQRPQTYSIKGDLREFMVRFFVDKLAPFVYSGTPALPDMKLSMVIPETILPNVMSPMAKLPEEIRKNYQDTRLTFIVKVSPQKRRIRFIEYAQGLSHTGVIVSESQYTGDIHSMLCETVNEAIQTLHQKRNTYLLDKILQGEPLHVVEK